jgi:hypothetical protein
MEDCKPCATPCVPKETIDVTSTDMSYTTCPFREAVGSLHYLATHTRPDISFTVGILGRAMAAPSAQRVVAVKLPMRYLSGTRDYGLAIGGTGDSTLVAYSDADWGGDIDRKSKSGALHYFDEDLVHWTSKKQSCVALSTAEAEYVAASSCAQDVICLRGVVCDLKFQQTDPAVFCRPDQCSRSRYADDNSCLISE